MKNFAILILLLSLFSACAPTVSSKKEADTEAPIIAMPQTDAAPLSFNMSNLSMDYNGTKTIVLAYIDSNQDKGDQCVVSDRTHIAFTSCVCSNGICSATFSSERNYSGDANFKFAVRANGLYSNFSTVSVNVSAVSAPGDSTPIALNSTSTLSHNGSRTFTLGYSDAEGDKATSCTVSNVNHLTIVNPCSCDASGACTVRMQAQNNYSGAASFMFNVTANGTQSNSAKNTINVSSANAVNHPPVAASFTSSSLAYNSAITRVLNFTDADGDSASGCSVSQLQHLTVISSCACSGTSCSVSLRAETNFSGQARFRFVIMANGQTSNLATGTFNIAAPTVSYDNYTSINFDIKKSNDGLPHFMTTTPLYAGEFLDSGDLFVGSIAGLAVSEDNGQSFDVIPNTVTHMTDIRTIYEDSAETLFIGGHGGISVSTDSGDHFTKKLVDNNINSYVRSITKFNSKLYVGADQGLFISENDGDSFGKMEFCPAGNEVTNLYNRDDQTLYISTMRCGLYTLSSSGTLTNYNVDNNGLGEGYSSNFKDWITGVTVDDSGSVYVSTWGGGVATSHDGLQTFVNKKINGIGYFTSVTKKSDGALILGTSGYGVYVTLDDGDTFAQLTPQNNNLPQKSNSTLAEQIFEILIDSSGDMFVLTANGLAIQN